MSPLDRQKYVARYELGENQPNSDVIASILVLRVELRREIFEVGRDHIER